MSLDAQADYGRLAPLMALRRRRAEAALGAAHGALRVATAQVDAQGRALSAAKVACADSAGWLAFCPDPRFIELALTLSARRRRTRDSASLSLAAADGERALAAGALQRAAADLAALRAKAAALEAADRRRSGRLAGRRDEREHEDRMTAGGCG
jgi:hypothetical protein